MTDTNRLPAIEALGEALAEMDGKPSLEAFLLGRSDAPGSWHWLVRYDCFVSSAETLVRLLALRGWTLTPGPTVNAGEEK